jgi:hypothetical protein
MPQKPSGRKLSILNCLRKNGEGETIGGTASVHFRLLSKFDLHGYYFNGNYYTLRIDSSGLLMALHPLE